MRFSKYHVVVVGIYSVLVPLLIFLFPGRMHYGVGSSNMGWVTIIFISSLVVLLVNVYGKNKWRISYFNVNALVISIAYGILFAVPEEIIFRGLVQGFLTDYFNITVVILLSSFVFGAAHLFNGAKSFYPQDWNWHFSVRVFFAGLPLGLLYWLTNSLFMPTILHTIFVSVIFFVSRNDGKDEKEHIPDITHTRKNYHGRKYKVTKYNNNWEKIFQKESLALRQILGEDALQIEHIGSTAVPGLAAKPTIDILVVVKDFSMLERHVSQIIALGYKDLGEYVLPGTRLFVQERNGERLVNLHFFSEKHPHISEMLLLREYLRSHPEEVAAYGQLKQSLSNQHPDDYGSYRIKKDEYVHELLQRAQEQKTKKLL